MWIGMSRLNLSCPSPSPVCRLLCANRRAYRSTQSDAYSFICFRTDIDIRVSKIKQQTFL